MRRSREKSSINPPRAAPAARLDPADGAPNVAAMLNTRMRMLAAGVALAGGCLAFGAKLVLVHACGSDVPYMDQWDAVGNALLAPRAQGELRAADFLRPHNEHRPVFTRLIDYALAVSNRQWDPLLEMTVNAAIHACLCAALLLFARRLVTGLRYACAALVITLLFVLPFDWENTLQGFQSQFYLLEWGALGTLLLCVPSAPLGPRWWAGWLVGAASLGTMSSGFMAAAAALLMLAARAALERRLSARAAGAAALLASLCAVGLLAASHVPGHDVLRSGSPWAWLRAAATALSWPVRGWPVAFLVLQLPVAVLAARRLRTRRVAGDEAVLIALAAWTWMQVAAIAYGRAGMGIPGSSRYTDLYAFGLAVNALALALLWTRESRGRAWGSLAFVWVALVSIGLWGESRRAHAQVLADLPRVKSQERLHIRAFLDTGDPEALRSAPAAELPFPAADPLARMLAAPGVRAMLAMGIRPAVALSPEDGSAGFEPASAPEPPPGPAGRVWIARRGPARFVSRPLAADTLPFLHVAVCGSPDLNAAVLRLESANDIEPDESFPLQGGRWHASDMAVPQDSAVRVVVDIPPGDHWFAFAEPVELGRGSRMDHWLLRRAGAVAAASGALFGAALAALLAMDLRRREWW